MAKRFTTGFTRRHALLAGSAATLGACVDGGGVTTSAGDGPLTNPNQTTRIALLVPAGTADENQNKLADNLVRAAELALSDVPSAKLDMRVYSTAANPEQAAGAATQALREGAKLIVGPLLGESALAVGRVAAARGINVLTFSNNTNVAGGNIITMGNSFGNAADRLIGYASAKGFKSLAVLGSDNAAGQLAASAARGAAGRSGVSFNGNFTYPFSPQGIQSTVPGVAAKVSGNGTQALMLTADSATGLPQIGDILRQVNFAETGIKLLGLARWDIPPTTLANLGLQGGWFAIPDGRSIAVFNTRFTEKFSTAPHPLSGIAYDGVMAVATLLAEGNRGALQRSHLSRETGFKGSAGAFRILSNNTTQRVLSVAEVNNGTFRIISNAAQGFAISTS